MRAIVNLSKIMLELAGILITERKSEIEKGILRSSVEQFMLSRTITVKVTGAQRMDHIIHLCTSLPHYEMSFFQRCCLDEIIRIISPVVFKGCSAQDLAEYFQKTGRKMTRKRMCFLTTSRRSGKTDLLTIVVGVCLIVLSNLEILCWSLYNVTAELFGRTVIKWIIDLGYGHYCKASKDHIIYRVSDGDVRTVFMMGSQNPNVTYLCYYIYIYIYIHLDTPIDSFFGWRKKTTIYFCNFSSP